MLAHMMMMGLVHGNPLGFPADPLAEIDIPTEYARIQKKESDLSSNLRARVVQRYKEEHWT